MIYVRFGGRLGNWMFQYAMARSLHVPFKVYIQPSAWNMRLEDYQDLFKGIELVESLPSATVYRESGFRYAPIPDFPQNENVILFGDWQSERYFDKSLVRRLFAPSEGRVAYLRSKYGDWLARPDVTGVSVRRTDYLAQPEIHPFLNEDYYERCFARLGEINDYVVCSDDIQWCKAFFPRRFPKKRFFFVEGESAMNQLYVHALCKNNIMSNSSFSWWSAWLNPSVGKRVLAPSMWLGCELKAAGLDWSDVYFEGVEIVKSKYAFSQAVNAHSRHFAHAVARLCERVRNKVRAVSKGL